MHGEQIAERRNRIEYSKLKRKKKLLKNRETSHKWQSYNLHTPCDILFYKKLMSMSIEQTTYAQAQAHIHSNLCTRTHFDFYILVLKIIMISTKI